MKRLRPCQGIDPHSEPGHVMVSGPPLLPPFAVDTLGRHPNSQGFIQSRRDTAYGRDSRVICCEPIEF